MLARALPALVGLIALGCSSDDTGGSGGGGGGSGGASASCSGATGDEALECQILELVNQQRDQGATCGGQTMPAVGPLEMHPILRGTARAHAEDMVAKNYFDHDNLEGKSPFDRMKAAGYSYSTAGENIAAGSASPEQTMGQWMGSTGHCENIMKGQYVHLGVGYAHGPTFDLEHVWVQNFGAPL